MDRFERVEVGSIGALWGWLSEHHGQEAGVWLVTFKKGQGPYVSRDEVLDALIAWGWIDGVRRKLDAERTMQLISPRRQKAWAGTYKVRARRLIDEGRMEAPGLRALEAGKANGLWTRSDDVDALVVPQDLAAALETAGAVAYFEGTARSYRRNVLRWVKAAAGRIAQIAAHSARGVRVPQY